MSLLTIGSIENLFKIYKNNLVENNILPFLNAKDRICLRWTSKTLSNIISKIQYKYFPNGRLDFIEGKIEMRLPHEIFPDEKINFGFTDVFATKNSFWSLIYAGVKENGTVVIWTHQYFVTIHHRQNIKTIKSTRGAFAALTEHGGVLTWGSSISGGDTTLISHNISRGVKEIFSTEAAFAALKLDHSVVVWGDTSFGGDFINLQSLGPQNIKRVVANRGAFAALKFDGSVICWGAHRYGGNFSKVVHQLSNRIVQLTKFSDFQFCAKTENGYEVVWPPYF